MKVDPVNLYWGYMGIRAEKLQLPFNSPEERARLQICHARVLHLVKSPTSLVSPSHIPIVHSQLFFRCLGPERRGLLYKFKTSSFAA